MLTTLSNLITAKNLDKSKNLKSRDVWLPRQLGTFHLKDAGFVEVYPITDSVTGNKNATSYADSYNLYITTFNAGMGIFIQKTNEFFPLNITEDTKLAK